MGVMREEGEVTLTSRPPMLHQLVSPRQWTQLTRPNLFKLMTSLSLPIRVSHNRTLFNLRILLLLLQLPNLNLSSPHISVNAG